MGEVVKIWVGVFFLIALTGLGIGILSAQIEVSNAQNYKSDIVAEIENSNFNGEVMNGCIKQAVAAGYQIRIAVYDREGNRFVYTKPVAVTMSDAYMAEVELGYTYSIAILQLSSEHVTRGIAR